MRETDVDKIHSHGEHGLGIEIRAGEDIAIVCHECNETLFTICKDDSLTPEEKEKRVEEARKRYADPSSDSIEVDDGARLSIVDEGTWVQAWVWVPNPEKED